MFFEFKELWWLTFEGKFLNFVVPVSISVFSKLRLSFLFQFRTIELSLPPKWWRLMVHMNTREFSYRVSEDIKLMVPKAKGRTIFSNLRKEIEVWFVVKYCWWKVPFQNQLFSWYYRLFFYFRWIIEILQDKFGIIVVFWRIFIPESFQHFGLSSVLWLYLLDTSIYNLGGLRRMCHFTDVNDLAVLSRNLLFTLQTSSTSLNRATISLICLF